MSLAQPEPGAPDPDKTRVLPPPAGPPTTRGPTTTDNAAAGGAHRPPVIADVAIEGEIGRGGMGVVYKGRQTYINRTVAIKVLSAVAGVGGTAADEYVARFQREARILATLGHPHIVACYQAGLTADGAPFLVMEYIDGPNLWQWLREHRALPEAQALRLTADIARALGYAYEQGIIHRDVKPENILLASRAGAAEGGVLPFTAKLVDLGLARPDRAAGKGSQTMHVTMPGVVMGTPATMAPEQFDDPEGVDHRADIYGLGCVLYHALTGRPAFGGTSLVDIVTSKVGAPPPDPRQLCAGLSPRTTELVRSMLAPRRDDRPQSYQAIIDACESAPGTRSGQRRGADRAVVATVGLCVALAATAGGLWWSSARGSVVHAAGAPAAASPAAATSSASTTSPASATLPAPVVEAVGAHPADQAPPAVGAAPLGAATASAMRPASSASAFAPAQALLGAGFERRLDGWDAGPGWAPEEEGGDGISGLAASGQTSLISHHLDDPQFRLTGLLTSGSAGARRAISARPACCCRSPTAPSSASRCSISARPWCSSRCSTNRRATR